MAMIELKGLVKVTAKGRTYYYAWRGGPRLPGEPGSREFLDALAEAKRKPSDKSKLRGMIIAWKATDAWAKPPAEGGMADSTKRSWRGALEAIDRDLGNLSVRVFDRPECRQIIKKWRSKWKDTPRAADLHKQVLSALMSFLVDEGKIGTNPCIGISNLYTANRSAIIWTQEDVDRFAETSGVEFMFALRLACLVGMRKADLLKLRWDHVGDLAIVMKTGKSKGRLEYVVPLYAELRALLAEIRAHQKQVQDIFDGAGRPVPVFTHILVGERGQPWSPAGFGSLWNRERVTASETRLHFHDARGTAATKFALAGYSDEDIAEVVGWDVKTVKDIIDRYVRRDARLKAKIDKMGGAPAGE